MDLTAAAKAVFLVIVDEVGEELEKHPKLGGVAKKWLPVSGIDRRKIPVGSPEAAVLAALRKPTSKDLGELASIALASNDAELVFVAHDKNGMWLALRELHLPGERLIGVPVFLRRLRKAAGLPAAAVDDVMNALNHPAPSWWQDWRTGF